MSIKELVAAVQRERRVHDAHRQHWASALVECNDEEGARRVLHAALRDDAARVTMVDLEMLAPELGLRYVAFVCAKVAEHALTLAPDHALRLMFLALARSGAEVLLDGGFINELVAAAEHHAYARRVRAAALELMRREDDGHTS